MVLFLHEMRFEFQKRKTKPAYNNNKIDILAKHQVTMMSDALVCFHF